MMMERFLPKGEKRRHPQPTAAAALEGGGP
jgi:hypothetical protein